MYLAEVTLRNWRSYRNAQFKFPAPKTNKKVVLVGAMNGTGKTSLLMGLHLGLFGREAMPFLEGVRLGTNTDEQTRSYKQLMQRILHRPALDSDAPNASIRMVFEKDREQIVITRTWFFTRGGVPRDLNTQDGEETRLEVGGRVQRVADWKDANNRIAAQLFPAHVMPCFFFDGEQAQERVEASGGHALADAIHALFGTTLLTELDSSLRTYLTNSRQNVKRDVGDVREDELERKRGRRDEIEGKLADLERDLKRVRLDLDTANEARKEKFIELTQLQGDALIDIEQLAQRKADLTAQEQELRQRLNEHLASCALPIALRKFGRPVVAQLEAEQIRDRWLLLRDETLSKVDGIVATALPARDDLSAISPPLLAEQRSQLEARMRKALEALWSPPPAGCAPDIAFRFLGASDRAAAHQRVQALLSSAGGDVPAIAGEWQAVRLRLRDIENQWDSLSDVKPKIEVIKQAYNELDKRVKELSEEKMRLEQAERGYRSELKDLAGAIAQMESLKRKLGPVEQRLDAGERIRSVIRETREKLVPLCKASLAEACTKHLRQMISDEYGKYSVNFDDELQPVLTGPKGDRVYVATLSGAQKRAFGLAFTLAVADVSGEEAPLVIDTPVGNMDSEYRKRILGYLAKASPGQLIFLSHDEEISGEYAAILEPYVGCRYLLDFEPVGDAAGISSPVVGKYFENGRRRR